MREAYANDVAGIVTHVNISSDYILFAGKLSLLYEMMTVIAAIYRGNSGENLGIVTSASIMKRREEAIMTAKRSSWRSWRRSAAVSEGEA